MVSALPEVGLINPEEAPRAGEPLPLLVDLPLIGKLFGETRTEEDKNDLLILVTPHIVDEGEKLGAPGSDR